MTTTVEPDRLTTDQARRLKHVHELIKQADHFEEAMYQVEQETLALLDADRLTIYQKDPSGSELVAIFRTADDGTERRLAIGLHTIGGFVALSQQPVCIEDVYDPDELRAIHPKLRFDSTFDRTSGYLTDSMLCVPIASGRTLLGVLEIINRRDGLPFEDGAMIMAADIAEAIGRKFRYDMKSTNGPYDLLIEEDGLTLDRLEELENIGNVHDLPVTVLLRVLDEIPAERIGASLERFYMVPWLEYNPDYEVDPEMLAKLNEDYLAAHRWVPFRGTDESIIIMIDDPSDTDRLMQVEQLLGAAAYDIRVGMPEDILLYLGTNIFPDPEAFQADRPRELEDYVHDLETPGIDDQPVEVAEDLTEDAESEIVNLVNQLIVRAVNMGASDIHLNAGKSDAPGKVRFRIDGVCREITEIPARAYRPVLARIKIMSRLDIAEKRKPQDGKIAVSMGGKPLELRVATVPTVNGEGAVLRVLAAGEPMPFEKLNFTERNTKMIREALSHPHGIVLVVGPTGSGKTTTLHGLLGCLNTPERNIMTAEDPVEITQTGLSQVQVQPKIGLTFASALRCFLRADPDVILIGEMRDQETAHAGIEASLTGHLVFSTLHTNSAPETIIRLLDMGLDPMNFADALVAVVAQRLVRTVCKECAETYTPDDDAIERLHHMYGDLWGELEVDGRTLELRRGAGCEVCGGTGYKGRTGIHEVLFATKAMKRLVGSCAPVVEIRQQAVSDGMRTLAQDGVTKILRGQTDLEQLRSVTVE